MIDDALVSVIIPFLNPGCWLAEAVNSVIQQTYINWEIILVDDGSTETDSNLAKQYAERFAGKIFYVEHDDHKNLGLTVSRNKGVAHARGGLIAFLDADDCWLPGKLEYQLGIFNANPQVQMICEASCFWYSWQYPESDNFIQYAGVPEGIYQPVTLMENLYPLGEGAPPCPSGIIITKAAMERCDGFEERFSGIYQLYEDQAFLSKVYSRETVYVSAKANNMYRKRSNSMSSAANDKKLYHKVRTFYCQWLQEYFTACGHTNNSIDILIEKFRQKLQAEELVHYEECTKAESLA